jgi:hypothetical protein
VRCVAKATKQKKADLLQVVSTIINASTLIESSNRTNLIYKCGGLRKIEQPKNHSRDFASGRAGRQID